MAVAAIKGIENRQGACGDRLGVVIELGHNLILTLALGGNYLHCL